MVKYFSSSCMGILKWEVFLESHGFSYLEVERSVLRSLQLLKSDI